MARIVKISPAQAQERAGLAREHMQIALERLAMCRSGPERSPEAQAAAANAVLAGIAASDALCGQALGERAADQDHRTATTLLERVQPNGAQLASKLGRLLSDKTILQYGTYCARAVAAKACRDAQVLVAALDARNL